MRLMLLLSAVKLAHVDMYVRIVAERRKRKAMARDYDLVPAFFKQARKKRQSIVIKAIFIGKAGTRKQSVAIHSSDVSEDQEGK